MRTTHLKGGTIYSGRKISGYLAWRDGFQRNSRKLLGAKELFIIWIVVMVSQVNTYIKICQIVRAI